MNEGGETTVRTPTPSNDIQRRSERREGKQESRGGNQKSQLDAKQQKEVATKLKDAAFAGNTHTAMEMLAKRKTSQTNGVQREGNVLHAEDLFVAKEKDEKQTPDTGKTQDNIFAASDTQAAQKKEEVKQADGTVAGSVNENTEENKKKNEPELTEEQKATKKMLEQNEAMQAVYEQYAELGEKRVNRMMRRLEMMTKETDDPEEKEEINLLLAILQLIAAVFQGTGEAAAGIGEEVAA